MTMLPNLNLKVFINKISLIFETAAQNKLLKLIDDKKLKIPYYK